MKLVAKISCLYSNEKNSRAVAKSIQPDNLNLPSGLKVLTKTSGKKVISSIELEGKIETLLATVDDLLGSAQTAENML